MSRLLLEIGTEAIPAGYLPPALAALETGAREGLKDLRLGTSSVRATGTAKRLVLEIDGLSERQEDRVREVQGPRVDVAFRDGVPTAAAEGFARKNGVGVAELERVSAEKGEFLLARVHDAGEPAVEVLVAFLPELLEGLSWPKTMVWNTTRFRFPRPIRWIVCLLDDALLPVKIGGISAECATRGHWLLDPGPHRVDAAGGWEERLKNLGVILDPAARRELIQSGLEKEAKKIQGDLVVDAGLLDEVVFLAEHPQVFSGGFDAEFLELPREVVVTAMRSHQRYFAVQDGKGKLLPHFLVVADGSWKDPSRVIAGNERVLRARLSDARFYWDVDRKSGMDKLAKNLESMVWLESVGTLREKADRVTGLVDGLGEQWFPKEWPKVRDDVLRASQLAKADLAGEMIRDGKEFTGLQGMMGARYAEAEGESKTLVNALAEQYLPRGAGDPLPESTGGTLLAFADRLDTVVGCWSAGFVPTGSQDPYALRRAANGMVRILLEKEFHLTLPEVVATAVNKLPPNGGRENLVPEVLSFLSDRLAFFLREQGISYDVVDAVLVADADDPLDAMARARALQAIRADERLERLVIGFKRASNILKGIDESKLPDPRELDWSKTEKAEQNLHKSVQKVGQSLVAARGQKDYAAMLKHLLELRGPIDTFFDDVLVMTENVEERDRRLALLAEARELFHHLFDPARIVIEGETES